MQLRKVSLRDWKCYAGKVEFSFPAATEGKNISLIGAANGFGKTALYEAVVLGMFGRDGMPLLYRARFEVSGDNQNDQTYVQFLSRTDGRDGVLNRTALTAGVTDCSVELVFDDEAGRPIRLQRIWHFTQQGALKRYEEEVQAFEGHERRPVGPRSGMATANDRLDWFRDWIAKTFVPYYLGWFFLFDGEMVKTFADQGMREQVRNGIEGLLGLPLLRDLANDLRNYARVRGGSSGGPQNGTIEKAESEEETLTQRLQEVTDEEKHVDADLRALEAEREELTRILHGLSTGTQASSQELYQRLAQRRADLRSSQDRLAEAMEVDLALALPGPELRGSAELRLRQEERREQWQNGREQGDVRLEAYVDSVREALANVSPSLSDDQIDAVILEVRAAWGRLWFPPDDDTAPSFRHAALLGAERQETIARLGRIAAAGGRLLQFLQEITVHEADIIRLEEETSRVEAVGPGIDEKRTRLAEVQAQLGPLHQRIGGLRLKRESLEGQLSSKRAELANLRQRVAHSAPGQKRAAGAARVAQMIDAILAEAVPGEVGAVAEAMTEAFRAMSHKGLVDKVEIDSDCSVRLLTKNGAEVTGLAASAGEQQLFSLALIQSVLLVSKRSFPIIVDTPLGRLDERHRIALMKQFASLPGQVILLSTDTEVVGPALAAITDNIAQTYVLQHAHQGDVGATRIEQGYFERLPR
jgi:DNA sulfur modification protein DndD